MMAKLLRWRVNPQEYCLVTTGRRARELCLAVFRGWFKHQRNPYKINSNHKRTEQGQKIESLLDPKCDLGFSKSELEKRN